MNIKPTHLDTEELNRINAETHQLLMRFKLLDLADIKVGVTDAVHQAIVDTLLFIPCLLGHVATLEQPPTDEALWRRVRDTEALLLDVRATLYAEHMTGHLPPVLVTMLRELEAKVRVEVEAKP